MFPAAIPILQFNDNISSTRSVPNFNYLDCDFFTTVKRIIRILRKNNKSKLKTIEIKFFRKRAGYTLLNLNKNWKMIKDLGVYPVGNKIQNSNCIYHVARMEDTRISKVHRRLGRPLPTLLGGSRNRSSVIFYSIFCISWSPSLGSSMIAVFLFSSYRAVSTGKFSSTNN